MLSEAGDAAARIEIAVCGAHLSGQPLNRELLALDATYVRTTRTARGYRLYALAGANGRPGLVFDGVGQGGIEVEIWALRPENFGLFVAGIPAPLGIGSIALEDGNSVKGFLCEAYAIINPTEITRFKGWCAYLRDGQSDAEPD